MKSPSPLQSRRLGLSSSTPSPWFPIVFPNRSTVRSPIVWIEMPSNGRVTRSGSSSAGALGAANAEATPSTASSAARRNDTDAARRAVIAGVYVCTVGAAGFEPATSCSQSTCANQAALRPVSPMLPAQIVDFRPLRRAEGVR